MGDKGVDGLDPVPERLACSGGDPPPGPVYPPARECDDREDGERLKRKERRCGRCRFCEPVDELCPRQLLFQFELWGWTKDLETKPI